MDLVLDRAQLKDFFDALIEAFPDRELLRQRIWLGLGLSLNRFAAESSLETTVAQLLRTAEAEGWLVLLLRWARREQPGNATLLKLEQELLPHFTTDQLQRLERLVQKAPMERLLLEQFAKQAAPTGWQSPPVLGVENRPATTFMRLVDSLSSASTQTAGAHPLAVFIDQLAQVVGEPTAGQLQQWLREVTGTASAPTPAQTPRQPHTLRLFVKCESKKSDAGRPEDELFVTAWLWSLDVDHKPLSSAPEKVLDRTPSTLGKLPELVSQVLQCPRVTLPLWKARDVMTIEVCLRNKLLSQNVDEWPHTLGEGGDSVRLGFRYPLVVRPYERLYESQWQGWGLWQKKWEQLKQVQGTPGSPPLEWLLPGKVGEGLAERLGRTSTLCVVIPMRCEVKLLQRSVEAGAPAVLTLRLEGVTPQTAKRWLKKLLEGPLIELPERVYQARKEPRTPQKLEKHITLVWDDPDRLPPDARDSSVLAAPAIG
jgi:hypothetical protein